LCVTRSSALPIIIMTNNQTNSTGSNSGPFTRAAEAAWSGACAGKDMFSAFLGVVGWILHKVFWEYLLYTCAVVTAFLFALLILHLLKEQLEKDKFFRAAVLNLSYFIESALEVKTFTVNICRVVATGAFHSGPFFWDCTSFLFSSFKMILQFGGLLCFLVLWFFRFVYLFFGSLISPDIKLPDECGPLRIPAVSRPYMSWLVDPPAAQTAEPVSEPAANPESSVKPEPAYHGPAAGTYYTFNAPPKKEGPKKGGGVKNPVQPAPTPSDVGGAQAAPAPTPSDVGGAQAAPSPAQEKIISFIVTSKDGKKKRKIECAASQMIPIMDALSEDFNCA